MAMKQRYRRLMEQLPSEDIHKLILLTGARQVGKTTLVQKQYPELAYFNLDSPELRFTLDELHSEHWGLKVGPALLDEVQKSPQLFEKIKFAFDNGDLDFSVLLGSSQLLLMDSVKESLAGRIFVYELFPLMLQECLYSDDTVHLEAPLLGQLLNSDDIASLLSAQPLRAPLFSEAKAAELHLLRWGGMPELLQLDDAYRQRWLSSYQATYLEKDLRDLGQIRDLRPFSKIQKLAALRSAQLLSMSELARDAGSNFDTTQRYIEYLRRSYQMFLLAPYYKNVTSSVIKTPKLYVMDIGLLRQLTGNFEEVSGAVYESYVVSEIFKYIRSSFQSVDPYFYRTKSGFEIDLLLKNQSGVLGIEIKNRDRVYDKDISSLRRFAKASEQWRAGLCVYRGDTIQCMDEELNIWAVPSSVLFS